MNIISKFIVNRNNLCYIYVEKHLTNNVPTYHVYYDSKSFILTSDIFHSIYGNDKKIAIEDFLILVETSIVEEKYDYLYHKANKLLNEISGKNRKNPLLLGYTYEFCNLLDVFNDYIFNLTKEGNILKLDDEINYEEEYQRLIKQEF